MIVPGTKIDGITVKLDATLMTEQQFRFPRSRKRRIRKKWRRDRRNFKLMPFPYLVPMKAGGVLQMVGHPDTVEKITKGFKKEDTVAQTLGEALPKEQARVREVLATFKEIGPAGAIGAFLIEQSLQKADKAVMSGDVIAMLVAYDDLKKIEG